MENFLVQHADGSFSTVDFAAAPADTAKLTASEAWAALASAEFLLPAEAESLLVVYVIAGEKAISLSDGKAPLALTFEVETIGDATLTKASQALALSSDEAFNQAGVLLGVSTEGLRQEARVILRVYPSHQKSDAEVVASLGHVYDLSNSTESASLKSLAARAGQVPASLVLEQNFPNPFNPETSIRYNLPEAAVVTLVIYDQLGRKVRTLVNQTAQPAGYHRAGWDGRDEAGRPVATGIYLYKITAGRHTQVRKMVLQK
ncbi:MAG: T9SS type A sorting domain-containing protein [candidate division KSB1 bacterium]|nr:T9SS type A sorting domain-containing protein [candidate division KSB1 bacterium]MDZ7288061.1 T9SS type A sorting domain-containing protein [candidate division KSB1 bacterium]MDZ7300087.1 T9SS type A sorting domain-containing protein [candidate division KSB1 bacterium]MDZ7351089.1 T9SS type A sorting domain-containing protein [candidate division KSB1 bacterium]MDZ7355458.1 T9SS type A sorting domain-containing protein [candidate division KSB1 bacterium]